MILIIGGLAAGKREYAKTLGYTDADMTKQLGDGLPVLFDLQDLAAADPAHAPDLLPELLKKQVVICNEVGSGVIPAERSEREGREAVGRLTVLLAKQAEKVVRVVCGIPIIIKG